MNVHDEQSLLQLARQTIAAKLSRQPLPEPAQLQPIPDEYGGVFVTIKNRGRLRGCIGQLSGDLPLAEAVQRAAVSVLDDPRFVSLPVQLDELASLSIEISVLSPVKRTDDPLSLVVGVHGIYIRSEGRSAVFLPQVAVEQGWDAPTFLSRCCATKAGLSPDAWRNPQTEVHLFTANVLSESR